MNGWENNIYKRMLMEIRARGKLFIEHKQLKTPANKDKIFVDLIVNYNDTVSVKGERKI